MAARREIQSDYWSLTHLSPSMISLVGILLGAVALPPAEKGNSKHGRPHWVARRFGGSGRGLCLPVRGALQCASALTPKPSSGPGPNRLAYVYHLGDDKPNAISSAYILYKRRMNQFGKERYDKFRNTRTASGFRSSSTRLSYAP